MITLREALERLLEGDHLLPEQFQQREEARDYFDLHLAVLDQLRERCPLVESPALQVLEQPLCLLGDRDRMLMNVVEAHLRDRLPMP